jgi:hypothetical protein
VQVDEQRHAQSSPQVQVQERRLSWLVIEASLAFRLSMTGS